MSKINQLRLLLKQHKISAFLLPNSDEFQNEYLPLHNKRIEWLTGFTGSAATLIITQKNCGFFTDGRYVLQASRELNLAEFDICNTKTYTLKQWLKKNNINELWYDPYLHTEQDLEKYNEIKLKPVNKNPVDLLWKDKPKFVQSKIILHEKYSGKDSKEKCKELADSVPFFITRLDSICWLLNIRASDMENMPILLSYAVLHTNGEVDLFLYGKQDIDIGKHVTQHNIDELEKCLTGLSQVAFDPGATVIKFVQLLNSSSVIRKKDPCQLPKACKNSVEIEGAKKAHIRDGIAVTEFIYWLNSNEWTEESAAKKLLSLRKKQELFLELSFPTISAFGKNGAIVHYTWCNDNKVEGNDFYLCDSGGQYLDGTTDVTRTIPIGKISDERKYHYTLVLKGHIELANAVFPKGTTGKQLDVLARKYLWQEGLDYDHGTGHGVGSCLGVHEGPQSMSNDVPLQLGMILSNEPGFYLEGKYGIRIENLMYVVEKENGYLGFEILTLVPINLGAVNLITREELSWIRNYNLNVYKVIGERLTSEAQAYYKCTFLA
ncbi:MAG: M24 family metallopeptidase [Rickettsiaceae bacterium H1]|nr:M24 family metallopeptidase [Rickettsiaceae bacterium H1]